jgi:hypothetical protein
MKYVVALKREARNTFHGSLADYLRPLPGVCQVTGEAGTTRVQVEVTEEGYAEINRLSEGRFHIEPLITHRPIGT